MPSSLHSMLCWRLHDLLNFCLFRLFFVGPAESHSPAEEHDGDAHIEGDGLVGAPLIPCFAQHDNNRNDNG
jgi:hypothetical protein